MGQGGTLTHTSRTRLAGSFDRAGDAVTTVRGATDRFFGVIVAYLSEIAVRIDPSDRVEAKRLRSTSDAYSLKFTPLSSARRAIVDRALGAD